jgi:hypothetical protein
MKASRIYDNFYLPQITDMLLFLKCRKNRSPLLLRPSKNLQNRHVDFDLNDQHVLRCVGMLQRQVRSERVTPL